METQRIHYQFNVLPDAALFAMAPPGDMGAQKEITVGILILIYQSDFAKAGTGYYIYFYENNCL